MEMQAQGVSGLDEMETNNGDGSWTLTLAQLSGVTITPPADLDTGARCGLAP